MGQWLICHDIVLAGQYVWGHQGQANGRTKGERDFLLGSESRARCARSWAPRAGGAGAPCCTWDTAATPRGTALSTRVANGAFADLSMSNYLAANRQG